MEIIIRSIAGNLYVHNTVANTPAAIKAELLAEPGFLVRDLLDERFVLIPFHAVAEFIQMTKIDYFASNAL